MTTPGEVAAGWIAKFLVHSQGDRHGQPFTVHPFQRAFLGDLYKQDSAGRRIVRRALLGMGKGNGKTELAAAIAILETAGPFAPESPDVIVVASSLEQSGIAFDAIRAMIAGGPLAPYFELFETEINRRDSTGRIRRIAANFGTADGLRPTAAIFDEVHEFTSPTTIRTHLVVSNGLVKRANGLELNISTAGANLDSLLGRLYQTGLAGEDQGFLFRWYSAADGYDLDDEAGLREAIQEANPAVGAGFLVEDRLVARFREVPRVEGRRYLLNQWTTAVDAAIDPDAWAACADPSRVLDTALPVVVGIDLGIRTDQTAVVVAQRQADDVVVIRSRTWANPYGPSDPRHREWSFDLATLEAHLHELRERFPVPASTKPDSRIPAPGPLFLADPWGLRRSVDVLRGEGLNVLEVRQHDEAMVPAALSLHDAVLKRRLAHDGDPMLALHVANAVARDVPRGGWRLAKSVKSGPPIDAAVAAAMAVHFATITDPPALRPVRPRQYARGFS